MILLMTSCAKLHVFATLKTIERSSTESNNANANLLDSQQAAMLLYLEVFIYVRISLT